MNIDNPQSPAPEFITAQNAVVIERIGEDPFNRREPTVYYRRGNSPAQLYCWVSLWNESHGRLPEDWRAQYEADLKEKIGSSDSHFMTSDALCEPLAPFGFSEEIKFMRKILPVLNQSTANCAAAARAAQIASLTLITFDQAEERLESELKEKGMRMTLVKINELKKDFVRAVDEALRLGLPVNDYAARCRRIRSGHPSTEKQEGKAQCVNTV